MIGLLPILMGPSDIAFRTAIALGVVAVLGAVLLAVGLMVAARDDFPSVLWVSAANAFAYLAIALAIRFAVQHHRSRLQIALLLAAVACVEVLRWRPETTGVRALTWLAGSVAVCFGVVMAKWALEPGALSQAIVRFQVIARR